MLSERKSSSSWWCVTLLTSRITHSKLLPSSMSCDDVSIHLSNSSLHSALRSKATAPNVTNPCWHLYFPFQLIIRCITALCSPCCSAAATVQNSGQQEYLCETRDIDALAVPWNARDIRGRSSLWQNENSEKSIKFCGGSPRAVCQQYSQQFSAAESKGAGTCANRER